MNFWTKSSEQNLALLVLASAFAAHVRYESALIVLPVATLIVADWIRKKTVRLPWALLAAPVLFLPIAWQYRAIASNPEKFQYQVEGSGIFSLNYLQLNAIEAFTYFFVPSNGYASSPFVSFIGFASLIGLVALFATRRKSTYSSHPDRKIMLGAVAYISVTFVMVLCFFMGYITQPVLSRLALPMTTLLILAGSIGLSLLYRVSSKGRIASFAFISLSLLYAFKLYGNPGYNTDNRINAQIEWVLSFAENLPSGNYLFVSNIPQALEVHGYNNINTPIARYRLKSLKFHLEQKTYNEIYLVQNLALGKTEEGFGYLPLAQNNLGPAVDMETVKEASLIPYNLTRINRIKSIDLDRDVPPVVEKFGENESAQFRGVTEEQLSDWKKSLPRP